MNRLQVNPSTITIAMIARGFTQQSLAEQLEVTQSALSKWINGNNAVPNEILEKISSTLNYPSKFFYEDIKVLSRSLVYYRRKSNVPQSELNRIHYDLYIQKHSIKKLLEFIDLPNNVPYLNPDIYGTPDKIAQIVRQRWKMPRGPVGNLMNYAESAGIIVLWVDGVEIDHYKGQVLPDEDGLPIIALNKNMPADLQRFTLGHEIGHLIMHHSDFIPESILDPETTAHKFSSELLMPKSDISMDLSNGNSLQYFASLKPYWKTSIQSIIRRAKDLGFINDKRYNSLNVQISSQGMKKNEPNFNLKIEKPTLVKLIIDACLNELEFTTESLADKMCMTVDDFKRFYERYSEKPKVQGKLQILK